jgi:tryptophanyl-tRNA synthetase
LLERAHSYKDKLARGMSANVGLFSYPILMAADILIYDSDIVPVGKDQKQHIEITRDLAVKMNETFGPIFKLPEPRIRAATETVPGIDGQKMSKSYGNTIEIFGDEKALQKKIMAIKMDSRLPAEPKPDADKNLAIQLLKIINASAGKEYEEKLRAGGLGYGDLKKKLFEAYWEHFAAARQKRAELAANLDFVNSVLADGAARARTKAREVLKRARKASGLE